MNHLPNKLAILRKHYNYSQQYIAKVLGIDIVEYMGFENGRSVLNHEQIEKLSKFYHISYQELFRNDSYVTLYKVDRQETDKINIEYFISQNSRLNKSKSFFRSKKLYIGIGIGILVFGIGLFIFNIITKEPVQNEIHDINTLSVSNNSVLYLNSNGAARGSGDNSNSQLSNLPTEDVVKVLANDDYSVFLLNDGTLCVCGNMDEELKDTILKRKDIIDIAIGDEHIVTLNSDGTINCFGSNDNKQCDLSGTQKVSKIFAGKNASVAVGLDGKTSYSGDFFGKSSIKELTNIKDIDFNDSLIIYLKEDGTVDYNSSINNKCFLEVLRWDSIVDVACGKDFFVGLRNDGTVLVASNDSFLKEAEQLEGIKAIDAADKYFIAYDGESIYGYGENRYNQFISSISATTKLDQVDNVEVNCSKESVVISFGSVVNASCYEVSLNDYSETFPNNLNISLDASSLSKGESYTLLIKALGDGYYKDSEVKEYEFVYQYDEEQKEELIKIDPNLNSLSKEELEIYLSSLNVNSIESSENDEICSGDKITVCDIEGIIAGGSYTKSDLEKLKVKYRYCKIEVEQQHEEDLDSEE